MSARLTELNDAVTVEEGDLLYLVRNNQPHRVAAISFAGAPGADGDDGADGLNGVNGADGLNGVNGVNGLNGVNGVNGANGVNGNDGVGIPTGGTTGQMLVKASNADHDTAWNTLVANLITDATTVGKAVLTAANNVAARAAIGAGTSSFSGEYADLANKPTLGDAAAKNTGTSAGTVAAGDHTHAGGSAPAGTVILLSSDETDSAERTNNTIESQAMKSYTLLPNTYNKVKVEAIVRCRNDADLAADPVYTMRFKVDGNTVKTFAFTNCGTTTTGADGGDTHTAELSTIVNGGQVGNAAITITGQMSDQNASMGILIHAFRVYGIL